MDTGTELEKLIKNIYTPTVFYIPYALFPNISEERRKKLDSMGFFNTLGYIDTKGKAGMFQSGLDGLNILNKPKLLKASFMQLIELESRLRKETFSLLFGEYLNAVHCYRYTYKWMAAHVDGDIPSIETRNKNLFEYQSEVLVQHLLQINHRFVFHYKGTVFPLDFKKVAGISKDILPLDNDLKTMLDNSGTAFKKAPKINVGHKGKQRLPSLQTVDAFLLKTVFNIDVEGTKFWKK